MIHFLNLLSVYLMKEYHQTCMYAIINVNMLYVALTRIYCPNKYEHCPIKITFVQTLCLSIFFCLFQALHSLIRLVSVTTCFVYNGHAHMKNCFVKFLNVTNVFNWLYRLNITWMYFIALGADTHAYRHCGQKQFQETR